MHDSTCLEKSTLNDVIRGLGEYFVVADSAYSLAWNLMKPYLFAAFSHDPVESATQHREKRFNQALSRCRVVVENAFGLLKGRFRWLYSINVQPDILSHIVVAACVLHNISLEYGDIFTFTPRQEKTLKRILARHEDTVPSRLPDERTGKQRRHAISVLLMHSHEDPG